MSLNLLSMSCSSMLISCTPCFFSSSDHQIMHRYQASFQLLLVEKKSGAAAPQQQQQQQLQLQLRYNNLYSLQLAATTTKLIMSISSCSL
jgi:hypothetical protein